MRGSSTERPLVSVGIASAERRRLGIAGVVGWAALLFVAARRLRRASRRRAGDDGRLAAGFSAAIAGVRVAKSTFDAMEFTQVTFVFWIMIALAAALLLSDPVEERQ